MKGPDEAWAIKRITRQASERIFRHAFEYARRTARKKVTAGHKANVLNLTDGLFLQCGRDVAAGFPDIAFDDCMVDALCLRLVKQSETIDVLVLPNQYGDILSDLCGGIAAWDWRRGRTSASRCRSSRPRTGPRPISPDGGSPIRLP